MHTEAEVARAEPSPEERRELDLIARRREAAGSTNREFEGRLGLALSGGGIRSATFCLGLLRALAKKQSLHHVDYLSTVSGGGYIGAAYTRLYGTTYKPQAVEAGLASDESVFLWWLRNNGRYLTPAGARDVMQALASIFRGALASHFEFAMLLASCAAILLLLPVIASGVAGPPWLHAAQALHMSVWWWVAAASVFFVFHQVFAYWFRRSPSEKGIAGVDWIAAIGTAALAAFLARDAATYLAQHSPGWRSLVLVAVYLSLWSPLAARLLRIGDDAPLGEMRLRHTKRLATALRTLLILFAAGVLDLVTYEAAKYVQGTHAAFAFPGLAALTAIAHWVQSHWKAGKEGAKGAMRVLGLSRVLNLLGLLFLLIVVLTWTIALQWLVQFDHGWTPGLAPTGGFVRWLLVFAIPVAYVGMTLGGLETLNLSSLHNFYRARLERAYVSTGNAGRFGAHVLEPMQLGDVPASHMRVAAAMDGDDTELARHDPHEHGGPIHLVNCCINQTVDDRTQAYNADRKGVALAVSSLGVEIGTHWPAGDVPAADKLSKWIAISGAAASSGMGSQTTPGAAAFLFLSAIRLGYWQRALGKRRDPKAREKKRPELLFAECFARFPGMRSPQWYLSDGGHFENTAVYALLKRKTELIVVADCGADPSYGFEDVENLVRKAAIDYAAKIEFLAPPPAAESPDPDGVLRAAVGLPSRARSDIAIGSRAGAQWLLLGRITYHDGTKATLVVVKPRVTSCLTLDTLNYAGGNAAFPQQTTGDQFFDEAQWEAYHALGVHLGRVLTPANLAVLQKWTSAPAPDLGWPVRIPAKAQPA